ncbi:hypothetical protein [Vibrio tapetis]|uniref:Uncharacterized protein n=1 Tax=Vibrio tapetis subsp. tapetis TaxID=1671868 RepID=A0A2N8ZKA2_9VIBR|nr:hypothetical protein [Vibrio tapetis]SON52335.1 conserved membrane protein of unknown function [Vibrio tapetis subsp. tapetis]
MKKYISLALVIIISFAVCWFFIIELIDYYETKNLIRQIDNDYAIVYIDPTYLIIYATFLFIPPYVWFVFKLHIFGKDSLGISVKLVAASTLIALALAVPGQIFEHQRQKSIARDHGFVDCPPFTLLSSTHIVEAMVKDPQYCTDDEITSIAMYGYFRELPAVNAYVDEVFGKEVLSD